MVACILLARFSQRIQGTTENWTDIFPASPTQHPEKSSVTEAQNCYEQAAKRWTINSHHSLLERSIVFMDPTRLGFYLCPFQLHIDDILYFKEVTKRYGLRVQAVPGGSRNELVTENQSCLRLSSLFASAYNHPAERVRAGDLSKAQGWA